MPLVIKRLIAIIFSTILFFVLFFTSIEMIVYNLPYYEWHYENRSIMKDTGMNLEDLMDVTQKMVDYLQDQRDTLDMQATIGGQTQEVFGEREKQHMVDVKALAVGMHLLRNIGLLLVILSLVGFFFAKKELLIHTLGAIKKVFLAIGVLIVTIGALLVIDFDKYFTIFHKIFFTNDLWLLDPTTDILINMVPEIFFFTTAMLVIGIFAVLITITILGAEVLKKRLVNSRVK